MKEIEQGKFYWVRCFSKSLWEVAKADRIEGEMHFRFCNGGTRLCSFVYSYVGKPIEAPVSQPPKTVQ